MSEATVAYVCKYLHKGKSVPMHQNDDRRPEYSLMSKGLGASYLSDAMVAYHRADLTRTFVTHNGFKKPMSRYYRERIYDSADRLEQSAVVRDKSMQAEYDRELAFLYVLVLWMVMRTLLESLVVI